MATDVCAQWAFSSDTTANNIKIVNAALSSFGKIARYLGNPLVLIGFVLLLFYGIHEKLIDSGILPPVTPETSGVIVQVFLRYGFRVAVLLIVLGFIYAAYKTYRETEKS